MKTTITLFTLLFSLNLYAQSFVNGGLEGVVDQFNPNLNLNGWDYVSYLEPFSDANWAGGETSDITGSNGPLTQYGISGYPNSGSTFVSGLYGMGDTTIWHEGIQQTVSGFSPDEEYTISFYQANIKQVSASTFHATDESGGWSVYVDGALIYTSPSTTSTLAFDANFFQWEFRQFTFIASDTSHTFAFMPADDDPSIDGAAYEALRMGIDDIEIQGTANLLDVSEERTRVYPNPTSDELNVSFSSPVSGLISLIDSKGRLIQQEAVTGTLGMSFTIDAPAGTYILEIREDDGSVDRVSVVKY